MLHIKSLLSNDYIYIKCDMSTISRYKIYYYNNDIYYITMILLILTYILIRKFRTKLQPKT